MNRGGPAAIRTVPTVRPEATSSTVSVRLAPWVTQSWRPDGTSAANPGPPPTGSGAPWNAGSAADEATAGAGPTSPDGATSWTAWFAARATTGAAVAPGASAFGAGTGTTPAASTAAAVNTAAALPTTAPMKRRDRGGVQPLATARPRARRYLT